MADERLAIVDVLHGAQPLRSHDDRLVLAVNGEIYDHVEIRRSLGPEATFRTDSDCEVILPLYSQDGPRLVERLRGMFAFALYDAVAHDWMIARDPLGIIPLHTGRRADGTRVVASEMKALLRVCEQVEEFPPGHYMTNRDARPVRYWTREWFEFDSAPNSGEVERCGDSGAAMIQAARAGRDALRRRIEPPTSGPRPAGLRVIHQKYVLYHPIMNIVTPYASHSVPSMHEKGVPQK